MVDLVQIPALLAAELDVSPKLIIAIIIGVLWLIGAAMKWIGEQLKSKPPRVRVPKPSVSSTPQLAAAAASKWKPAPPPLTSYAKPGKSVKPSGQKTKKRKQNQMVDVDPDETHTLLTPVDDVTTVREPRISKSARALMTPAGMRQAMKATAMFDRPVSERG